MKVEVGGLSYGKEANLRDEWSTPMSVYKALDREFGFTLDACATGLNRRCVRWCGPGSELSEDGLEFSWEKERVFVNPPYSRGSISSWVQKCCLESRLGSLVVAILPARVNATWFHDYVYGRAELRFLRGRIKFEPPEGVSESSPNFDTLIAIWR